jgi:hypothetical protein
MLVGIEALNERYGKSCGRRLIAGMRENLVQGAARKTTLERKV